MTGRLISGFPRFFVSGAYDIFDGMAPGIPAKLDPVKARRQLEEDLLQGVQQRREEWINASDEEREYARERFVAVLRAFHDIVLHDKEPNR